MSIGYGRSKKTVWKRLQDIKFSKNYCDTIEPGEIILLIDTTYFGKKYGYMIFRAWFPKEGKGKNLLRYKVPYETNAKYREGYSFLVSKGRKIKAIVCDGRRGLLGHFGGIPTQLCIHHMKQIIVRLLTKKPKLEQTKSLKMIANCIGEYPEGEIKDALNIWFEENKQRLNEKNDRGRYAHERARKAYRSITNKLKRCYEFAHYSYLEIPKTNNSLESINSHLKTKISIHRGIKENNKDDFTNYYLYIS